MEYVTLNNGLKMPLEGFGTFQITDLEECERVALDAFSLGYRLVDTAAAYGNERAVGAAIAKCGIPRDELFVTTKLWIQDAGYEEAKAAFSHSLDRLGLAYLDLYLIHQPFGNYYGAWKAMEELYREGKIRAIGVCNFSPDRLTDLCIHCKELPVVNQIEIHPFLHQKGSMKLMGDYGVQAEAWGPLSEGGHSLFTDPVLSRIGDKYGKTPAQVALRWNIQRGVVVIPKSINRERLKENMEIWDFSLSEEDMAEIEEMDIGHSEIIDYKLPSTVRMLSKYRIYDNIEQVAINS